MKRILTSAVAAAALMTTSALADTVKHKPKMSAKRVAHAANEQSVGLTAGETIAFLTGLVLLGALINSGDSMYTVVSDARLKTDATPTGASIDGIPIYTYRYLGDDTVYEGVMAQDVLETRPDAVVRTANGYLAVDYGKLGLRMRVVD